MPIPFERDIPVFPGETDARVFPTFETSEFHDALSHQASEVVSGYTNPVLNSEGRRKAKSAVLALCAGFDGEYAVRNITANTLGLIDAGIHEDINPQRTQRLNEISSWLSPEKAQENFRMNFVFEPHVIENVEYKDLVQRMASEMREIFVPGERNMLFYELCCPDEIMYENYKRYLKKGHDLLNSWKSAYFLNALHLPIFQVPEILGDPEDTFKEIEYASPSEREWLRYELNVEMSDDPEVGERVDYYYAAQFEALDILAQEGINAEVEIEPFTNPDDYDYQIGGPEGPALYRFSVGRDKNIKIRLEEMRKQSVNSGRRTNIQIYLGSAHNTLVKRLGVEARQSIVSARSEHTDEDHWLELFRTVEDYDY